MEKLNVVSKKLGVSKGKIKDMIKNGKINFELVNGVYYVDENEVKSELETTNTSNKNSQFDEIFHSYITREIKKGKDNNNNRKFQKMYSYIKSELEKPSVEMFNVININSQNDYSY